MRSSPLFGARPAINLALGVTAEAADYSVSDVIMAAHGGRAECGAGTSGCRLGAGFFVGRHHSEHTTAPV